MNGLEGPVERQFSLVALHQSRQVDLVGKHERKKSTCKWDST